MGKKFTALPVQLIETSNGIIARRGCAEFKIEGDGAAESVKLILETTSRVGMAREEIYKLFTDSSRPRVRVLIDQLISRRFLVPDGERSGVDLTESSMELFCWHFGHTARQVGKVLNRHPFVILGVNSISRQLASALADCGLERLRVVDHPQLRNQRLFNGSRLKPYCWPTTLTSPEKWTDEKSLGSLDCLIATCDFGGRELMRQLNRYCVKQKLGFLPVVLQDLVGYLGPLVVPGETACFECLWCRENSNSGNYEELRLSESVSFNGQFCTGFHPSMASILGDLAAFEITTFLGRLPVSRVGTLFEINLLRPALIQRKVLKVPRCVVCSPLNYKSSMSPDTLLCGDTG